MPALTVSLLGEPVSPKSDPAPDSPTNCGVPRALSLMVRVPLRIPEAVGVNVMLIVQLELAAIAVGHVLVCA
jgi:hypothetical protein